MTRTNPNIRHRRHKKILKLAKGFTGSRSKHFKIAHEAVRNAGFQKTESRKKLKRFIRKQIWIPRINSFARTRYNLSYNQFIYRLNSVEKLDRKIICQLIIKKPEILDIMMEKCHT